MIKVASVSLGYPDRINRVKLIFTHEQAMAFKNAGCEIDVFDLSADRNLFKSITHDTFESVPVYRFPVKKPIKIGIHFRVYTKITQLHTLVKNWITIRKLCRANKYDIVLFSFLQPIYLFFLPAFNIYVNTKLCLTTHGVDAMGVWNNWIVLKTKKIFLSQMDYVFPVSDYTSLLVKTMIRSKHFNKIILNYNGLNKEKFSRANKLSTTECRHLLELPKHKKIILTVCDLVERKGVDILLRSDKIITNSYNDFIHVIIGRGPEKQKLLAITQHLNLNNSVFFIDYVEKDEDLMMYYKACDVYAMISRTIYKPLGVEGFGISYIEASYLGKPVIGGHSGGTTSAVKDFYSGFLVNPEGICPEKKVAEYMLLLFEDKEVYDRISSNGRKFVSDTFDWQINVQTILERCKR